MKDVLSSLNAAISITREFPLRCRANENKPLLVQTEDVADHVLDIIG